VEGVFAVNLGWGVGEDGLWGNGTGWKGIQTRRGAKGVVPVGGVWDDGGVCDVNSIGWFVQQGGVYAEWVGTEWEESRVWL
jgi:hypothetical protein